MKELQNNKGKINNRVNPVTTAISKEKEEKNNANSNAEANSITTTSILILNVLYESRYITNDYIINKRITSCIQHGSITTRKKNSNEVVKLRHTALCNTCQSIK